MISTMKRRNFLAACFGALSFVLPESTRPRLPQLPDPEESAETLQFDDIFVVSAGLMLADPGCQGVLRNISVR